MGYLTLRLKGVFFAIATLAMAIVAQTLIVNWDFVGGSRGIYIIRPQHGPLCGSYIQYLYSLMMVLSWSRSAIARTDRALAARARLRRDPRRRAGGRGRRGADPAAEADRHDLERRVDGHVGRAPALLRDLSRPGLELQSRPTPSTAWRCR